MEEIVLNHVSKNYNSLTFDFSISAGLKCFFSSTPFQIEYPMEITSVPDAIATVPFVCNILPIVWLTNSKLFLKSLDKSFFDCIPDIKKGYETMFPESDFGGEIIVDRIISCNIPSSEKCAAFFSGGLDAVQTLVSHLDEKPDLISIWGSDIQYDNQKGWDVVHKSIAESCKKFDLPDIVIRSSFREFDNEWALGQTFSSKLKDGWWHGVKHGIGLLGHAAPYAYLKGLSTIYIASSNCPADGPVRCASNPTIDNYVRFANCKVVHDGFEFSRQDKVRNVVQYCRANKESISLHVCWQSQSGGNCCKCEKCYRTISGIIAEGAKPETFGFDSVNTSLSSMHHYIASVAVHERGVMRKQWTHIQKRIGENKQLIRRTKYWKHVRWILSADFYHPETIKPPLNYRIRAKLSTFRLYQAMHRIKNILKLNK